MSAVTRRLAKLEQQQGSGRFITVGMLDKQLQDLPPEELQRRIAAAERDAGPNGTVVLVPWKDLTFEERSHAL